MRIGPTKRRAEIVEDRGLIGIGGRRILRVRYIGAKGEEQPTFEVPLDHVMTINTRSRRVPTVASKAHAV